MLKNSTFSKVVEHNLKLLGGCLNSASWLWRVNLHFEIWLNLKKCWLIVFVLFPRYSRVTSENRTEYVKLAMQFRLHEFDPAVACVREGMSRVVPVPLLSLFTGYELETMVCGSPDIPLHLLKSVATYKGKRKDKQRNKRTLDLKNLKQSGILIKILCGKGWGLNQSSLWIH